MTLCIAAECDYEGKPAVAMCCDWRGQTGNPNEPNLMVGTEDIYKMFHYPGASVMLAGSHPKAIELLHACRPAVLTFVGGLGGSTDDFDLHVTSLLQDLRKCSAKRKKEIINHFVEMHLGISLAEFYKLPNDNFMDERVQLRHLNLGAEAIFCAAGSEPVIVRLDRFGEPHWESNYTAIGDGAEVARAFLCLQEWTDSKDHSEQSYYPMKVPLHECLYRIYEAKIAAHTANPSSVGSSTAFQVLTPDGRSEPTFEFLTELLSTFKEKHRVPASVSELSRDSMLHRHIPFTASVHGSTDTQLGATPVERGGSK